MFMFHRKHATLADQCYTKVHFSVKSVHVWNVHFVKIATLGAEATKLSVGLIAARIHFNFILN